MSKRDDVIRSLVTLDDNETVKYGDFVFTDDGSVCIISKGSFHGLMAGVFVSHVRTWNGVVDIKRKPKRKALSDTRFRPNGMPMKFRIQVPTPQAISAREEVEAEANARVNACIKAEIDKAKQEAILGKFLSERLMVLIRAVGGIKRAAKIAGVKADALYGYVSCEREVELRPIGRLCAETGYSLDWVFTGFGPEKKQAEKHVSLNRPDLSDEVKEQAAAAMARGDYETAKRLMSSPVRNLESLGDKAQQ